MTVPEKTAIRIREYQPEDLVKLQRMYSTFEPRGAARGLPPIREEKTSRWLNHLGQRAKNLVALDPQGQIVGHAILAEGDDADAELALFVHQDSRGAGLGTRLTLAAIELAGKKGYGRVWLTVAPENIAAIRVYQKSGFHMLPGKWFPDHEMEIFLKQPAVR
jgi:ribosomal protein S18 acetylase RimI-like enzyme